MLKGQIYIEYWWQRPDITGKWIPIQGKNDIDLMKKADKMANGQRYKVAIYSRQYIPPEPYDIDISN